MRDVSCYETTTSTLVDDALCTDDKPDDVESCNENPCLEWILTPWSSCSATCGPGTKMREVKCPELDMCNPESRPNEVMNCTDRPCIDWVPGTKLLFFFFFFESIDARHFKRAVDELQLDLRRRPPVEGRPVYGSADDVADGRLRAAGQAAAEAALC